MKIIIRKGVVKVFRDSGSLVDQLTNLEALIAHTQSLAAEMHVVADCALSVDPKLVEYNKTLKRQLVAAHNTINLADKQLERNAKKVEGKT
jgi:hypothetical protein